MFEAQNCIEIVLASDGLSRAGRIYANNGSHLIIATDPEDAPYFSLGADVTLVHLQEDSLYKMETTIVQCTGKGIGVPIRMARFAERRRSQRVKCEVGLLFTPRGSGPDSAAQAGSLRDISQTGARIFTSRNLLADSIIMLDVNLDGSQITPQAEIIRCVPLKPTAAKKHAPLAYDVALRFVTVPRLDQMHLHRYMVRHGK